MRVDSLGILWPLPVGRVNNSRSYLSVLARFLQLGTRSLIKWSVVVAAPTVCHRNVYTNIDHRAIPASIRATVDSFDRHGSFSRHIVNNLTFNVQPSVTVTSWRNTGLQITRSVFCSCYTSLYVGGVLVKMKIKIRLINGLEMRKAEFLAAVLRSA